MITAKHYRRENCTTEKFSLIFFQYWILLSCTPAVCLLWAQLEVILYHYRVEAARCFTSLCSISESNLIFPCTIEVAHIKSFKFSIPIMSLSGKRTRRGGKTKMKKTKQKTTKQETSLVNLKLYFISLTKIVQVLLVINRSSINEKQVFLIRFILLVVFYH